MTSQATIKRTVTPTSRVISKRALTPKRAREKSGPTEESLRLVPLGGLEEVGRNMSYLEYKDEIVIIDMGIQFPEEETPGIDYIIPNVSCLLPKKQNIKAVVLTHGHYDHIGAVPYLIGRLGNPPVYTLRLTKGIIEKRQEEFVNAPKLNVVIANYGDKVKVGKYFELEFFGVQHTIPDTTGIIIKTPIGNVVHFADFRIDYDAKGNPLGLDVIERVGKLGVHTFMVDSTNAEEEGRSLSEKIVEKNLEILFREAKGRIIVSTFSSMLTRIAEMIKIAERLNRRVIINGRSMKDNVQIAQKLGYIKFKKETVIPVQEIDKYKDHQIMVISTGAQGELGAGLMKITSGEHRYIKIKPTDTVIFSASVIPGNERGVQNLKDALARQGADVFTSAIIDIHSSGHAPKEDLRLTTKLINPRFVMPVHGYYFMRAANGKNAVDAGVPRENVRLLDNGQVALLTKDNFVISKETVPANYIMVDGLGVGDVEEVVLRDRLVLAQEGMVVLIVTIDRKTGRLVKNPDIISRGFIYLREHQELLNEIRNKIRGIVGRLPRQYNLDVDYLKSLFRDQVGQFIYSKTNRRPMILPVIIEV
ncbi:MAG: ribonuclease J, partial [Candidatus Colwellbacteria bacterium]|nr:ribonuclease J [Candidatus Colwellbacteria bacterium]